MRSFYHTVYNLNSLFPKPQIPRMPGGKVPFIVEKIGMTDFSIQTREKLLTRGFLRNVGNLFGFLTTSANFHNFLTKEGKLVPFPQCTTKLQNHEINKLLLRSYSIWKMSTHVFTSNLIDYTQPA